MACQRLDLEERVGSDTEVLFRQESNFIYLSGFDHPEVGNMHASTYMHASPMPVLQGLAYMQSGVTPWKPGVTPWKFVLVARELSGS
jgi:Xaa-Pro aminopeptidase